MKSLLALVFLVPFAASAASLDCSIKAAKTIKKTDMPGMAKVSVEDAKKTALGAVNASGAAITKGGLEVEDGCLVYSYDVKIPGKNGIEEVIVDAGSGKVLKTEHEGSVKEALEKTVDTMKK